MASGDQFESAGEYGAYGYRWLQLDPESWALALARRERTLWALVLLATLADVVSTVAGIHLGLAEGNPLIAGVLASTGVAGFLAIKAVVLAVAIGFRAVAPQFRVVVPLGLCLPWLLAASVNAVLIVAAL